MTLFKKDYLRLSVFPCPVILQRKYIYKALMPGSSLIVLKIWVRDWFCDWAQNESCSFMPSSKQVVLCTTLFIRWVWEPKQRKKKRQRENERKKLLSKKFPISPAILQEQTEQKQTFGVSSSSLSKSSVITLKLSLKIKSDYIIKSIILYLCSSL